MNKCIGNLLIIIFFLMKLQVTAQETDFIEIKGFVVDEAFNPISFVTVVSKSTGRGTICHEDGEFRIKLSISDTVIFSALSYVSKKVPAKELKHEINYIILEKTTYQLSEVNVMDLRWQVFKDEIMNKDLKENEKPAVEIDGLPNPFQKKVVLSPYAYNSNPISLVMLYFSKENIRKRKIKRWNKTYRKSWIEAK